MPISLAKEGKLSAALKTKAGDTVGITFISKLKGYSLGPPKRSSLIPVLVLRTSLATVEPNGKTYSGFILCIVAWSLGEQQSICCLVGGSPTGELHETRLVI